VKSAKQLGVCRVGGLTGTPTQSAAILMWRADLNGDGAIQFSELALLELSGTDLVYWEISYPSSWTTAQKQANDATLADSSLYTDSEIDAIKSPTFSAYVK